MEIYTLVEVKVLVVRGLGAVCRLGVLCPGGDGRLGGEPNFYLV
jgi:hypothetical protein